MNPGSVFGSRFGQPQVASPFGTAAGSATGTSTAFGTNAAFTSTGSSSQVFGSMSTANTSFGTVGGGTGFGLTPGTDSKSTVFGNPDFGSSTGNFGSSGPSASGFGSVTSTTTQAFSTPTPGFGTGTMNQNIGFGSSDTSAPRFGIASAFGSGTTSASNKDSGTGTQFASGFNNRGTTFAALSTASSVSGTMDTGSGDRGAAFGTGGSGFGGGATVFGASSSGFGTSSSVSATASSGFATAGSPGPGMGSSGFGRESTSFGTSRPGFGQVSLSSSTGASAFGITPASGFGGGSSLLGSFTATQGTSTLSTTQTQSSPLFGSSVFGTKMKTTGDAGHSFTSSPVVTVSNQAGSSVFGSKVYSTAPGSGGGSTSVFGQIPGSTAVVGSVTKSGSVFGTNTGTSSTGTRGVFGAVDKSLSSVTSTGTTGSVFGGAQAASVFGALQTGKETSQKSSSAGGAGSSGLPPPSYSASVSSGQPSLFASTSVASVFGGSSKAAPGGNVFGGASRATSGEGSVFGGAPRATSGEGSVFGGAPRTASGQGSVFGGAGRSVIKQESSQQLSPQMPPAAGAGQPPPSVFGSSHLGKFPTQKQTNLTPTSTHLSPSASVFGGKTNFATTFGAARQQQATDGKVEASSSVFGGRQSSEKKESLPRQPLFPAASSSLMTSSDPKIKHESQHIEETHGTVTSDISGQRQGPEMKDLKSAKNRQLISRRTHAENTTGIPNVFGGKREAVTSGSTFGLQTDSGSVQSQKRSAAGDEEGVKDIKRGRTEEQEDQAGLTTGGHFHGHPSTSGTPEKVKLRRSSSVLEDISSKISISCKGISANLNKGSTLRNHFSRFGVVKRVRPAPAKRSATIQFETHEAASKAKKYGTKLPGQETPLSIFWKSSATEKSAALSEEAAQYGYTYRTSEVAQTKSRTGESSQVQQFSLPSSVAAELASMSGADSDIGRPQKHRPAERTTVERRSEREGHIPHRKEAAPRTRSKTPPPSSSSTSSSSTASNLGKTANVTVSSLSKMVATTTMEKVNVLDLRDKLMRQKVSKQTSGGVDSGAFVGTCPDMCPEKERLYREEVRRLSIYEIIPGSSTLTGSTSLVNHTRAVKEYSRSSADQDEPLPHELRPLPVLTMTMNYLLVEVADCGEDGKWAEWYDFLWNRTRSIRKEITQQQLCSQEVVDLLEKCVRFHIYCSERLCTEDMMVFDSKINDENLTKCLQTLKELYADMENKHGMYCPNEAEFRAYIVLMNLNEGDTLREVQQLRHEVCASAEIGFAVKAYSALYSNNYVRFFRLVKSASFLNACILHRYFNQIRARALQVILKSHTAGQKKVGFPVSELQRLLVFENEEEVREFCSYYGIRAEGAELILDRAAYVEPEMSMPSWRAVRLVESKRSGSVGEVINGGPLQPVSLPTPQCSFDEQGRFIGSLDGLADSQESQERVKPFEVKATPKPPQLQPSPLAQAGSAAVPASDVRAAIRQAAVTDDSTDVSRQQLKPSSEVLKTIARELFFEVIDQLVLQMADSVISTQRLMRVWETEIMSDVVTSVVSDVARQVSTDVVDTETARQNQLLAAEKQEREARVVSDIVVSVIDSTVEEQAKEIVLQEIEEAEAREQEERWQRCTEAVQSELLQEVAEEMAMVVADEVHQVDVVARLQLLGDLQKAVELRRTSQWLAIWRKALKIRQRQKRAMLDFPCAPPMQSASQRLQSMYPDRPEQASPFVPGKAAFLVNHKAQMTLLSPLESEKRSLELKGYLSLASLLSSLQRTHAWQPLNLSSLLRTPLNQAVQQWPQHFLKELSPLSVQWKLLLSLPGEMEEEDRDGDDSMAEVYTHDHLMTVLKQWLCVKFTRGDSGVTSTPDSSKKNILSQYSIEVASNAAVPPVLRVGVCVRSVPEFAKRGKKEQPTKEQSLSITKGTSAILFLLPHADTSDDTIWLAARLRLARLLEAKPFLPATPLALLLPCGLGTSPSSMTDEVTRRLGVPDFQDKGLVSDVAVVELAIRGGQPPDVAVAAPVLQTQVSEVVKFLACRVPEPPDLRCECLGEVVEDMVNQHFFTPVLQDLQSRLHLNKLHQAPNTLIGLYNSVLDHVCLALTSPTLQDISWPAPELQLSAGTREDWNSKKHLGDVYELVSSLRLPWFHYKDQASTEWSQVCHDVWTFVNTVIKKRCDSAVSLTSRISRMLAHTCLQFENVCSLTQNEDHCTPTYVNAPWTDIIVACVEFRLQRLHNWKDEEEAVGGDVEVLFEQEDLEEFEPPPSWIQALLDTEDTESMRVEDTVEQASIMHFANQSAVEEDDSTQSSAQDIHSEDDEDSAFPNEKNEQTPHHNDLPENIRSTLETSEKLLLHVKEERQKADAFERYLEKALRGDTSPDLNFSMIFPSANTPRVVSTPALSSATPSRPVSFMGQGSGRALSASQDPSVRWPDVPLGYNMKPRRLTVQDQRTERFGELEGDSEAERSCQENLPLCEGVERFKENLQAQRQANELFEKRLQSLLET